MSDTVWVLHEVVEERDDGYDKEHFIGVYESLEAVESDTLKGFRPDAEGSCVYESVGDSPKYICVELLVNRLRDTLGGRSK